MILACSRSFFFMEGGRAPAAICDGSRALWLRSLLTRPALGALRRALFPGGDGETHCSTFRCDVPSELACTSFLGGGLGGFLLRAWTSTAFLKTQLVWCARSASKGSCLAHPFTMLRSQAAIGPCGFAHRRSRGDHSRSLRLIWEGWGQRDGETGGVSCFFWLCPSSASSSATLAAAS